MEENNLIPIYRPDKGDVTYTKKTGLFTVDANIDQTSKTAADTGDGNIDQIMKTRPKFAVKLSLLETWDSLLEYYEERELTDTLINWLKVRITEPK